MSFGSQYASTDVTIRNNNNISNPSQPNTTIQILKELGIYDSYSPTLDKDKVPEILKNTSYGSYLIRNSSLPGFLALDVNNIVQKRPIAFKLVNTMQTNPKYTFLTVKYLENGYTTQESGGFTTKDEFHKIVRQIIYFKHDIRPINVLKEEATKYVLNRFPLTPNLNDETKKFEEDLMRVGVNAYINAKKTGKNVNMATIVNDARIKFVNNPEQLAKNAYREEEEKYMKKLQGEIKAEINAEIKVGDYVFIPKGKPAQRSGFFGTNNNSHLLEKDLYGKVTKIVHEKQLGAVNTQLIVERCNGGMLSGTRTVSIYDTRKLTDQEIKEKCKTSGGNYRTQRHNKRRVRTKKSRHVRK
jgi:hypothetical protein